MKEGIIKRFVRGLKGRRQGQWYMKDDCSVILEDYTIFSAIRIDRDLMEIAESRKPADFSVRIKIPKNQGIGVIEEVKR